LKYFIHFYENRKMKSVEIVLSGVGGEELMVSEKR
jgi:hypothetical protein